MSRDVGTVNWTNKKLPDFRHMKAYILPGAFYFDTVALFASCGFTKASCVDEADVVVFIGGADVDPAHYNQTALPSTYMDKARDTFEIAVFEEALAKNKFMFGICRGAQFLHVMNGGKLWQDVNRHAGPDHWIVDIEEDVRVLSNSLHHQMIRANETLQVLAVTEQGVATRFKDDDLFINVDEEEGSNILEVEAGYYINTGCLFVQGHPEVSDNLEYISWCMTRLEDFLMDWQAIVDDGVDLDLSQNNRYSVEVESTGKVIG